MKIHMVKQGDSLYSIAKKYNVSLEDIIKANPEISNPDVIDVGMKVKVPSQSKPALEVIHHHIVQQGDTLWKLSKAWGIQLVDLIKANPQLKNPNALLTGEVVNIPKTANGTAVSPAATMHEGAAHGKANTGLKPSTGTKANTGIQPIPTPLPAPITPTAVTPATPVPTPIAVQPPVVVTPIAVQPPVVVTPIIETKPIYGSATAPTIQSPSYGHGSHYQVPMPYSSETQQSVVSPESTYEGHGYGHGYGMQQQPVVSPESTYEGHGYGHGYGMQQQPLVSPESTYEGHGYGYGMQQQPVVSAESTYEEHGYGHGYGMQQQPVVSPESNHEGYGHGHGYGYGLPPGIGPLGGHIGGHIGSLPGLQGYSYSQPNNQVYGQGTAYPMPVAGVKKKSGCNCGGPSSYSVPTEANAGLAPYADGYQGMAYSADRFSYGAPAYGVSPIANGPFGNAPQSVNPFGSYPGMQYSPYYGAPMGDVPLGANQGLATVNGANYGQQFDPYFGAIPPIPPLPPLGPLRENENENDRSSENEDDLISQSPSVKKRQLQNKPKAKLAASARQSKPRRKENLPWIKW
ncbi:LysM peptidoglycan-binding domain-containing protein [Cohnella abietis]|uniref:LysM domain-containing protein n=1 Tax=Cohnella abietis TaxID=2507935 RepID=A0A3T1D368_9BACL|nr:LysM peptidoglycan-binding domain-containing protein [Cohnella abietis]BBI32550.1 hypothetical protein KCTCHS21_19490 [Cohnella abietis]